MSFNSNSWRVSTIKLAHGWLERGVEAIFEPRFSDIIWRDILSHLCWRCSEVMRMTYVVPITSRVTIGNRLLSQQKLLPPQPGDRREKQMRHMAQSKPT